MKDFIKETLEESKTFFITSYEQSKHSKPEKNVWYGKAHDRTGMTVISWCTEGHSCTYFGDKLEPNISVGIGKDADTRMAFNGYCFSREDFERVLNLTW